MPNVANTPQELKRRAQWVVWRTERRDGKAMKVPHQPQGGRASSTDPLTWGTFEAAWEAHQRGSFDSVGYVLTADDPFACVDLDNCVDDDGGLSAEATQIVRRLYSYTEFSPGGKGLHIWVKGTLPPGGRKRGNVEMYDQARYLTITGLHLQGTPESIEERTEALARLHAEVFPPKEGPAIPVAPAPVALNDQAIIGTAMAAKNGAAFGRLWAGDWSAYPSQSEADLALCNFLAFYTGAETQRVDALFRQSGLFRPKWDERRGQSRYGELTIAKALEGLRETYSPSRDGHEPGGVPGEPEKLSALLAVFPRTDAGNGELFAFRYGEKVRYDHQRGRWLLWAGHWWRPDADGAIHRMVKDAARWRYGNATTFEDLTERQLEAKWAIGSESRARLDSALALAKEERPIADAGDKWDSNPWLLGVANGVVNLTTGLLRDGRPEDKITMMVPVLYDPDVQAPRWLRFLEEVFEGDTELVDYVHRAIGYSLTGDVREQSLWVLHGRGANGKSVFLTVLRALAGEYAHNAPFTSFEARSRPSIPNDLAALAGKRLVTASETSERARLNEARLKALTGGDQMTARFLNQEFFTFEPVCKLWLAVNHRPRVDDDSLGFWRRVRLIPFDRTFQGEDADPNLTQALLAELPGILAWAMQGCLEWQARGLEPPAKVQAATAEYREESDPLASFLSERCTEKPDVSALSGELYRAYQEWADQEGISQRDRLSANAFGRRLGEHYTRKPTTRGRTYLGIGLKLTD